MEQGIAGADREAQIEVVEDRFIAVDAEQAVQSTLLARARRGIQRANLVLCARGRSRCTTAKHSRTRH